MADVIFSQLKVASQPSEWLQVLGLAGTSGLSRVDRVREGLPVAAFYRFADTSGVTQEHLASAIGISLRTIQRRRGSGELLDPGPSERLVRLADIYAAASDVTGSDELARQWMQTPREVFSGRTPFELAGSELGAREVEDLLLRIEYGIFY